jgi:hypothetical protein
LNFLSVYAALSLAHHIINSRGALVLAAAIVCLGAFKVSSARVLQALRFEPGSTASSTLAVIAALQYCLVLQSVCKTVDQDLSDT